MLKLIRAFRAGLGINDVGLVLKRNRGGRAFEFTSAANGALRSDNFVGHSSAPLTKGLERPVSCPKPTAKMLGIRQCRVYPEDLERPIAWKGLDRLPANERLL